MKIVILIVAFIVATNLLVVLSIIIDSILIANRDKRRSENFEELAKQVIWEEPIDVESVEEDFSEEGKIIYPSQRHILMGRSPEIFDVLRDK